MGSPSGCKPKSYGGQGLRGPLFRAIRGNYFPLVLIASIGLAGYLNSFGSPFQWEDRGVILENPHIRNLAGLLDPRAAFESGYLANLTFALNYKIHGLRAEGFHAFNVALHILNAALVYLFVTAVFSAPRLGGSALRGISGMTALASAMLFASHPIQTQAVTYISQRATLIAAFLALSSLLLYVKGRLWGSRCLIFCLFSGLFSALAIRTHHSAAPVPILIALFEIFFLEGSLKKRAIFLAPVLLSVLLVQKMPYVYSTGGADPGNAARFLGELRAAATYLRLLLFPTGQNIDHHFRALSTLNDPESVFSASVLSSLLLGSALLFLLSKKVEPALKPVSYFILWYVFSLVPDVAAPGPDEFISEQRAYLPGVGFFVAMPIFAFAAASRFGSGVLRMAGPLLMLLSVSLCLVTYTRNAVWESETTLWEDAVRKSPLKARTHFNLANAYKESGLHDRAVVHYLMAVSLRPDYKEAYNNLGNTFMSKGKTDWAIDEYKKAIEAGAENEEVHLNLGNAYLSEMEADMAVEEYSKALGAGPGSLAAANNLGVALALARFKGMASERFESALAAAPQSTVLLHNIGILKQKVSAGGRGPFICFVGPLTAVEQTKIETAPATYLVFGPRQMR